MENLALLLAFIDIPISLFLIIARNTGKDSWRFVLLKTFALGNFTLSILIILKHFNFI